MLAAHPPGEIALAAIFPGQKARCQPVIRQHANRVAHAQILQRAFIAVAAHQIIFGLQHPICRQRLVRAHRQRLAQPLGGKIGCTQHAHLARLHQPAKHLHHRLDRRRGIVAVRVIKVDIIGPQPPERFVHRRRDPRGLQPLAARTGQHPHLGRDQHIVAPPAPGQPRADHPFRFAALVPRHPGRIGIGGIDHRPARRDEPVENGKARRFIDIPPEHIAAQHQRRRLQPGLAQFAHRTLSNP